MLAQSSNKIPPQNIDAEQLILGVCLLEKKQVNVAIDILTPDDFYREAHRVIFEAIYFLHSSGKTADLVTVSEHLNGKIEQAGGIVYFSELVDCIPTKIKDHCKIVFDLAVKRRIITDFSAVIDEAYRGCDLETLQSRINNAALNIKGGSEGGLVKVDEIVNPLFSEIEERSNNRGAPVGISTGLADLDTRIHGLQKGNYIVVAGRPGMGKTSLALKFAENAADDTTVAFFSLEMTNKRLVERLVCMGAKVDARRVRTGYISDSDWPGIVRSVSTLSNKRLYIDQSSGLSIGKLSARAKRLAMKEELGLVIVDYIQLMRGVTRNDRTRELGEISAGLLGLAKDLDVPVVVLSQLNRLCEMRPDKRPIISDLKESGAIEQDADIIMFVYRDEIYNKADDNQNIGIAELIIGKGRDVGQGTVKVGFRPERTEFFNLDTR